MWKGLIRTVAGAAAIPAGALLGGVKRAITRNGVVVDLTVDAVPDLLDRVEQLALLRRAAADPDVHALVLRIDGAPAGFSAVSDLRDVVGAFRAAGKGTTALLESPGNAGVWLACACERVLAVPTGELGLIGLGTDLLFFGDALRRVGLVPDLEAAGTYKSFGEPFTRSFASPENLEATRVLLGDLHDQVMGSIALDRGIARADLDAALADAPLTPEEALSLGLVDQLAYPDTLDDLLEAEWGEDVRRLDFEDYRKVAALARKVESWGNRGSRVAVLHLQGNIVMKDSSGSTRIRGRVVAEKVAALREDDEVAAVVLHICSPGGDALASDLIWREVEQLGRAKPVVASYEDVSASGGVYLSAPVAEIFVRPSTITGSIGVFGGKFVASGALRQADVHAQAVLAAPNATLFSATSPFTDRQRVRFKSKMQRFYDGFVQRVATGRKRPVDEIEMHCRGRVWTGRQAVERGLADQVGGLQDAIARAVVLSGLPEGAPVKHATGQPDLNLLQQAVADAKKQLSPMAANAMSPHIRLAEGLLSRVLPPEAIEGLTLLTSHESRALAMLPWVLPVR